MVIIAIHFNFIMVFIVKTFTLIMLIKLICKCSQMTYNAKLWKQLFKSFD